MFSLPNLLSILRMGLVPLFIIAVVDGESTRALVLFTIAGITDGLDGFIARFWGQQTLLGAYLDPIADKLLLTSAYVVLAIPALNPLLTIPAWVTVLVIARDVLIVVLALILHMATGQRAFPPLKIGKITTTAQIATVVVVLLGMALGGEWGFPMVTAALVWATAALTVVSGLGYIVRANRMAGERGAGGTEAEPRTRDPEPPQTRQPQP